MKRYISLFLVMIICFSFCSCASNDNKTTESDSKTTELVIADYYKTATDYNQIEPLLKEYFSVLEEAYANSDKVEFDTFILPDRYNEVKTELNSLQGATDISDILSGGDDAMLAYQKKLALLQPYLEIEVEIAAKNLLVAAGTNSDEEWFNTLYFAITEAYEYYSNSGE